MWLLLLCCCFCCCPIRWPAFYWFEKSMHHESCWLMTCHLYGGVESDKCNVYAGKRRCLCSWNPAKTVAFNWLRPVLLTVKRLMKIRIFRNQQIRIERQSLSYGFHCFMAVKRIRKSNRCLPFPFGLPSWCHRRVWFNRTIIDQTVFHIWRSV